MGGERARFSGEMRVDGLIPRNKLEENVSEERMLFEVCRKRGARGNLYRRGGRFSV